MQKSLTRKGNINFPGRESFPFLKGGFPWQVNPSLVKKKFPAREIASLAVKLIANQTGKLWGILGSWFPVGF